jgi:hypothetical protein
VPGEEVAARAGQVQQGRRQPYGDDVNHHAD